MTGGLKCCGIVLPVAQRVASRLSIPGPLDRRAVWRHIEPVTSPVPKRPWRRTAIDTSLLKDLRIEGRQREDAGGPPRWVWPAAGAVLGVVLLAGAAWWFVFARPAVVQVTTAVAAGSVGAPAALLQATGYVTARRQATVSTQITGTLTQVLIDAGDHVQKGQVIARLEDSALRATLNVAQANLMTAQAQVAQTQAQLAQSESDWKRQDELARSGMLSKQAAEQSRTAVTAFTAALDARRREVEAARAQLAQAKVNFDYTVVRAPFTGVVTVKAAQVGEIVSPLSAGGGFTRTGVGTIVDMDSLEVEVDVSEAYIGQVKPEMPCEAVLDAYPDWKIPAHVVAIVPSADRGKATVKVRVAFEQKDARMVPEMAARVSFLGAKPAAAPAQAPKGVLVPPQALAQRDGQSVLFVVVEGRAQQRRVDAVPRDAGSMKLLPEGTAVKAGERVVLAPPASLRDGAEVKVEGDTR